jgi:hypothetical protein
MFKCKCPNAKLSDNTLVLSLPDAITPVVWVMDMNSEGTFIIKVENNEDGYCVLQKISTKGKSEDIAFYKKRSKAINAMSIITHAMDGDHKPSFLNLLKTVFYIAIILTILGLGYIFYKPAISIFTTIWNRPSTTQTVRSPEIKLPTAPVIEQTKPDAVGVPMSADDFLKNKTIESPF